MQTLKKVGITSITFVDRGAPHAPPPPVVEEVQAEHAPAKLEPKPALVVVEPSKE